MHYGVRAFAMGKEKDEARTQSYADQRADECDDGRCVFAMQPRHDTGLPRVVHGPGPAGGRASSFDAPLGFVLRSGLANMLVASVPSLPEAMTLGESDITAVWSDVMTAVSLPPCRTSPMTCVASVPLSVLASLSGVSPSEFEPNGTAF